MTGLLRLLALWCCLAGLIAQEKIRVHTEGGRQICTVRLMPFHGASRIGGFGWVGVDVQNHDRSPHAVTVQLASKRWADSDVQMQRAVELGPEERARFVLPLPNLRVNLDSRISIDATTYLDDLSTAGSAECTGLLISERATLQPSALAAMQAAAPGEKVDVVVCGGVDVPDDWRCLTGFSMLLLDGRAQLAAGAQEALRRYVAAGGRVVVTAPGSLPAGPVHDRLQAVQPGETVRYGLGDWIVVKDLDGDMALLRSQLRRLPSVKLGFWPMSIPLLKNQVVPGLGEAPVLVFLSVMLLFALLAGPVNFLMLRRLRRPMLALVTVPALGMGTTLLMLGFGFFHDGFGVRGALRSWTVIDQEHHEAVAFSARTLFAGLRPAALELGPDSLLVSATAFAANRVNQWAYDANAGRLDGSVLPSRVPMAFGEAQQGVARQRLRFRQNGDALEVLTDGGIEPVGDLLVRDLDGALWGGSGKQLKRLAEGPAQSMRRTWQREASTMTVQNREESYRGFEISTETLNLDTWTSRMIGGDDLAPGTWVGRVAHPPWLDEHGLTVRYDAQEHFVVGHLAAEDFVR